MDVVCKTMCLICTVALTTGQFFTGSNHNGAQQSFQQNSRLSMPQRSGNSQHPDPRLAAQMGVGMHSRLSTGMPFNSLMPTTQVTMAPGIQRSRLGSPHPQTSTKAPPISLLQFLLDATPHPDSVPQRSVSASPHRPAPQTTRNIQNSPFRTVQIQATGQPLQGSRRMSPAHSPSSDIQSQPGRQNVGQERRNSMPLSSNGFRNPQHFQRANPQRVELTQTPLNGFSDQPVQNQLMSQWNNPTGPQSSSSSQNGPQNQNQFSSQRIEHTQTPQTPPVQRQWNPRGNVNTQPHSTNSLQNQEVQNHLSPQRVEPARRAPQSIHRNNQWQSTSSSLNQHRPSQPVERAPSPFESTQFTSSISNSNPSNPPNPVQVHTLQPLQSDINQFNSPYQNIAARRTALRQVNPQSVTPSTTSAPAPYEIRQNREPAPVQSSPSNVLPSNPIRPQSSFNVQQNQPVSYNVPSVEGPLSYMTSPNIVRSLPNTERIWRPQTSSSNVLRNLPDTQPVMVQKPSNVVATNVLRNLPDNQPPLPRRVKTRSSNIKQRLPSDQHQIDVENISQSRNGQISPASQQKKLGMNLKQNVLSNSLPNARPNSHLTPQRSESLQTPALQTNVNKHQKPTPLTPNRPFVNRNTNPTRTAPQSKVETKAGLIPTVINGKRYMINPNFVHLLQNLLSKAGLDMKTGPSEKVSANRQINTQRMESVRQPPQPQPQTLSDYEPPVTKQRIINDKPAHKEIKAATYTNLGTVSQIGGVNNQFKGNPNVLETAAADPNSLIAIKPQSPYSNTVQRARFTTSATAPPATERITYTNTPSFIPKSPPTPPTTTTPLPVTTLAPKRKKALLLPFRDSPTKQTTTIPMVKTTQRSTPPPPQSAPSQGTSLSSIKSVTPPPKNVISGTTKSANTIPPILTPRYLSDRRTVATEAPTTRSVGVIPTTKSPRPASVPIKLDTQQGNTLDPSLNTVVDPTSPALITPLLNQDPLYTASSPYDQSQNNANNEFVNELTPELTPTQESKVNVQFSFNLGHFGRNRSKKTNEEGSVFNDIYRQSDRLPPSQGVAVHKGFVGFNNKANNVELLVLR